MGKSRETLTHLGPQGKGKEWTLESLERLVGSCSCRRGPLTRTPGFSGETWPLSTKKGVRGENQYTNLSPLTLQSLAWCLPLAKLK